MLFPQHFPSLRQFLPIFPGRQHKKKKKKKRQIFIDYIIIIIIKKKREKSWGKVCGRDIVN